jgi:hypothetical protein
MKLVTGILILALGSLLNVNAGDYEITRITPIFDKATPGFGNFKIEVGIKNTTERELQINVLCLYVGLTNPGVYFKDEPEITKAYRVATIKPREEIVIVFDKGFATYHPEVQGEIIISIAGSGVIRSLPLKTAFHPESED